MALPRNGALYGENPGKQGAAVQQQHKETDGDPADRPLPESDYDEVADVPEDYEARPDVDGSPGEQPGQRAPDQGHEHRHDGPPPNPFERNQTPENQQWNGVGHEVAEAGVEERCPQDSIDAVDTAREYAVRVESGIEHELVDELENPHQPEQRCQRNEALQRRTTNGLSCHA